MQDAVDRLQSLENTAFMKKTTQRRKGAKTQRKRISRRDLGCLVLARRAAHPLPVVVTTGRASTKRKARRAGTSIWGMTVCGLSNPVYRPSGPLGL